MCDTMVATGKVTADGVTLFAKNSDREPNEAQQLLWVPAADHGEGSVVRCTYIEVPQVAHTHAVLLSKPFWMWGAEMGVNEHGLAIGNEAVFTRLGYAKEPSLTGMDMLRLALERSATAREAVSVITELLETHGQGGNCGYCNKLHYHNSFLLADAREAWVLETAGPHWAAKQVCGAYAISNAITLRDEWDMASPDLMETAVTRGWCRHESAFSFDRCYSDRIYTPLCAAHYRHSCATTWLETHTGEITPHTMMSALRDHGPEERYPEHGLLGASICMHASLGPVRSSQTTGSLVARLNETGATVWATGTAAPCTGLFKPFWPDVGLGDAEPAPTGVYDPQTLFWRHERLHRATLRDYGRRLDIYRDERDALEHRLVVESLALEDASAEERYDYTQECLAEADEASTRWIEAVEAAPEGTHLGMLPHRLAWRRWNRAAQLSVR